MSAESPPPSLVEVKSGPALYDGLNLATIWRWVFEPVGVGWLWVYLVSGQTMTYTGNEAHSIHAILHRHSLLTDEPPGRKPEGGGVS